MLSVIDRKVIFIEKMKEAIRNFICRFSCVKIGTLDYIFFIYTLTFGYICIHMPSKRLGWFVYLSPDAKTENSTFYRGYDRSERMLAMMRKEYTGHNWIYKINNKNIPRHEAEKVMNKVKEINENGKELFKTFRIFGF